MIRGSLIFHRDNHRYIWNYRSTSQNYYENYLWTIYDPWILSPICRCHNDESPGNDTRGPHTSEPPVRRRRSSPGEVFFGGQILSRKGQVTNLPTKSSDPIFHCWVFLCSFFKIVKYRSPSILSGFTIFGWPFFLEQPERLCLEKVFSWHLCPLKSFCLTLCATSSTSE